MFKFSSLPVLRLARFVSRYTPELSKPSSLYVDQMVNRGTDNHASGRWEHRMGPNREGNQEGRTPSFRSLPFPRPPPLQPDFSERLVWWIPNFFAPYWRGSGIRRLLLAFFGRNLCDVTSEITCSCDFALVGLKARSYLQAMRISSLRLASPHPLV